MPWAQAARGALLAWAIACAASQSRERRSAMVLARAAPRACGFPAKRYSRNFRASFAAGRSMLAMSQAPNFGYFARSYLIGTSV